MRNARVTAQGVLSHLADLLITTQNGSDAEVVRVARAEVPRLIGAINAGIRRHPIEPDGRCVACGRKVCTLLDDMSLALLPVILPIHTFE
jgi:hypothetical protein